MPAQAGICLAPLLVIPAKAGIHFDFYLALLPSVQSKASTRPAAERVTFFACAKKVTKRKAPPRWRALRASCPAGARGRYGGSLSSTVHVRQRTGAHPARHPAGFFLRALAAPQGAPTGRHPAAEARSRAKTRSSLPRGSAGMHGFVEPGAVRGAEHRRRRRKGPQGRAQDARASAAAHGCTVSRPRRRREAQGSRIRRKRIGPPCPVPGLLLTFGHCAAGAARTAQLAA